MLFNSVEFLLFFVLFLFVYFLLWRKLKLVFLLLASYFFYMSWKPEYAVLILLSTIVDFVVGLWMWRIKSKKKRFFLLLVSLFVNLWLLAFFKYYNFVGETLNVVFGFLDLWIKIPYQNILLPVGISFYTFQTLSYSIEVYRQKIKPTKNFLQFALYVSFFPQLVAGPIERPGHLLAQFQRKISLDVGRIWNGLKLVIWGLFQKVVIADSVAMVVDQVYNNVYNFTWPILVLASVLFAFQIYCDFAGYSNIAIWVAKMMWYDLMENFKRPYFSKSVAEFWKRWHISLSSWFKDYVYIPLGGSRVKKTRLYFNLMITFVISGLWHGASWTFVLWWFLNGMYLVLGWVTNLLKARVIASRNDVAISDKLFDSQKTTVLMRRFWNKFRTTGRVLWTFLLIDFAWIFFRANSFGDLKYVLTHLWQWWSGIVWQFLSLDYTLWFWGLVRGGLGVLLFVELNFVRRWIWRKWWDRYVWAKIVSLVLLLVAIVLFGRFGLEQFIYFQF